MGESKANGIIENTEVGLHFLDSGSFSLLTKSNRYHREKHCGKWDYYDTKEFWEYMDAYAAFVQKYAIGIDYFANVDVIGNPKLTWRNQRYFEDVHKIRPVPVVHQGASLDWLQRYMDGGHDFIALGGLVGGSSREAMRRWIDTCFDYVCDNPQRLPKIRLHGFGMTSYPLMIRFPWWSVDSATWTKVGAFGGIMLPHKRKGKFIFEEEPYNICMSQDSPATKINGKHYKTLSRPERLIVAEWLELIGVPMGKTAPDGEIIEYGVMNRHSERKIANLLFFERLRAWLPTYPWPFKHSTNRKKGFGLC